MVVDHKSERKALMGGREGSSWEAPIMGSPEHSLAGKAARLLQQIPQ